MRAALPLALLAGLLAASGVHAAQPSPSPSALAALAARSAHDPRALAQLRATTRVGGRAVDLAAALDVGGSDLRGRLRTLAGSLRGPRPPSESASPAALARGILAQRRFRGSSLPRPLHRPLSWLGGELQRLSQRLGRVYRAIAHRLPGGAATFWTVVCLLLAAAAALVAFRLGRRRAGRLLEARAPRAQEPRGDPAGLERDAERAERAGDFELALRLRFQAGLLRLAAAHAIPARQQLTNGEIARRLASSSFAGVAHDFDEVVYGGRGASGDDVRRAADGWARVLGALPRR